MAENAQRAARVSHSSPDEFTPPLKHILDGVPVRHTEKRGIAVDAASVRELARSIEGAGDVLVPIERLNRNSTDGGERLLGGLNAKLGYSYLTARTRGVVTALTC